MAGSEIDYKAEQFESRQSTSNAALMPDIMQNDLFRQLSQFDGSNTINKNGFPQLELFDGSTAQMKSEKSTLLQSKYDTGVELITDRELRQAGLNPKNVKHTYKEEKNGDSTETTSVKYPNGLEVSVTGKTKHTPNGDVVGTPEAQIKEPMPKGYHKDSDGFIRDAGNNRVARINEDGTVTVKVGKEYLTQGPSGVREEVVIEGRDGKGIVNRIVLKD